MDLSLNFKWNNTLHYVPNLLKLRVAIQVSVFRGFRWSLAFYLKDMIANNTNLFIKKFIDFMFNWIKELYLSSRKPNQQL